jgi:outer membrane protein assembly factor BamB|tara:strand:- start:268 stop:1608 length:1341 start_codon:yes stop_codon:yes gene_type:complete
VVKLFYKFLIILFLSSCSAPDWLDTERGIFGTGQKIVNKNDKNKKQIFNKEDVFEKEFNVDLKINLKENFKNKSFINNLTNNNGLVNFNGVLKKASKYKFKKIKNFEFTQPELYFSELDSIIFFDNKGTIINFNQNSKIIWKKNFYSKQEKKNSPTLYFAGNKKLLIVTDNLANYYAINLFNGELLWKKINTSPFNSQIKIFNNKFFAVDSDNVLRCFSLKDGKELWNYKTDKSFIQSQQKLSLVINNNRVIFVNTLGDLSSVDIESGKLLWQTPTQSSEIYESSFSLKNSDIILDKKGIFFSNNQNEFYALDETTGVVLWKQNLNSNLRSTFIENLIFNVTLEGYLIVIDSRNGNILRMTNIFERIKKYEKKGLLAPKTTVIPIGFIVTEKNIYISLSNGRLVSVDLKSGKSLNVVKIDTEKISRPYVLNNKMFVIKDNGIIKLN